MNGVESIKIERLLSKAARDVYGFCFLFTLPYDNSQHDAI